MSHLLGPFGIEPGDARQAQEYEALTRLRWVNCEACGGSGEIERASIVGPYEDPTPCAEICSACDGTGRDCIEVSPVECDDDQDQR